MLPAPLIALVRDHGATHEDFASLRYCLSGGDKVSATLDQEFKELVGQDIYEDYGMTEIGLVTVDPPSGLNKVGSVGPLNPGVEASIRDEDGNELPTGIDGRLWIRSPGNMIRYWNNPDATAETIVDGWL
ncbi:MAG: AMP-binding protein, partial [Pseudomonadota bacterium]